MHGFLLAGGIMNAYSDEAIKETIDANEYEFTEEGKLI
jgi:hypothetical protein